MIRIKLQIINKLGLHARAAAKLVHIASAFQSQINIIKDEKIANAKSIMSVMMLGATQHSWVECLAEGTDETHAVDAISRLLANRFGEER